MVLTAKIEECSLRKAYSRLRCDCEEIVKSTLVDAKAATLIHPNAEMDAGWWINEGMGKGVEMGSIMRQKGVVIVISCNGVSVNSRV